MISSGIVSGVLQNESVKGKLRSVLNENVFTNAEIQYYVHQALLKHILLMKSLLKTT